jgi:single-stranded DNA-binding protein
MKTFNNIHLLGFIGQVPEVKTTNNQRQMITFSVATHTYLKPHDGESFNKDKHIKTSWFQVVSFEENIIEVLKICNKGDAIILRGSLQTRTRLVGTTNVITTDIFLGKTDFYTIIKKDVTQRDKDNEETFNSNPYTDSTDFF